MAKGSPEVEKSQWFGELTVDLVNLARLNPESRSFERLSDFSALDGRKSWEKALVLI
jgi:hypothetical protein